MDKFNIRSLIKKVVTETLLKESFDSKYYWMDPDTNLHEVDSEGHAPFAAHYISTLIGKNKWVSMKDVYKSMYNIGWVRVAIFGHQGSTILAFNAGIDKNANPRQMTALKDLAIEFNANELRNNGNGLSIPFGNW